MANPEHVELVKQGAEAIAKWRAENPEVKLDLGEADLSGANLAGANLGKADRRITCSLDHNRGGHMQGHSMQPGMKHLKSTACAIGVVLAMLVGHLHAQQVPIPQTAAGVPGPAPGPMTKAYVQMVGRMAYLWGWPLVYVYNQRTELTKVPETGLLAGVMPISPMNQVGMLTGYIDPGEISIADPNQDVVYGLGYLSLAQEPVVIQVPDFGDRFWTVPVYDARTDQVSELGLQYGTKPGFYMVVGPNWTGATPAGIAGVVRSSTDFAVTMPRIFMNDTPEDHAAIQPALSQIQFYPLSQFDGTMKTKDWSKLPTSPVPKEKTRPKYSTKQPPWVDPAVFFDQLPTVMKQVPPMPGEEALYQWIGSVLDAAAKDPEVMNTLRETAFAADKELIAPMMWWRYNGQPAALVTTSFALVRSELDLVWDTSA